MGLQIRRAKEINEINRHLAMLLDADRKSQGLPQIDDKAKSVEETGAMMAPAIAAASCLQVGLASSVYETCNSHPLHLECKHGPCNGCSLFAGDNLQTYMWSGVLLFC